MPELPEVEVLCRDLQPILQGRTLKSVLVRDTRLRAPIDQNSLNLLVGSRWVGVSRRGKYLLFHFNNHRCLLSHLGMSGGWRHRRSTDAHDKHEHLLLHLDDGMSLRFHDPRRFGLVLADLEAVIRDSSQLRDLGPEPFDSLFDENYLRRIWQGRRGPVKTALMQAKTVVGVGNIYASEALFRAGIHPKRGAGRIALSRLRSLVVEVRSVLREGIENGGTTLNDYRNPKGESGENQEALQVYGREGLACLRCEAVIRNVVLGGRSSFYCPRCQR